MIARELMTSVIVTLTPDHSIRHAAEIMLNAQVSGLPVLTSEGELVGIVTEGDLLRRVELGTDGGAFQPEGLSMEGIARAYIKSHSWKVADAMTAAVISVGEDAPVREIVSKMVMNSIKRVPVTRDGKLVGIVSRCDLLKFIAAGMPEMTIQGDDAVERSIKTRLADVGTALSGQPEITVSGGRVRVQGTVRSAAEHALIKMIVERVAGASFDDELNIDVDGTRSGA